MSKIVRYNSSPPYDPCNLTVRPRRLTFEDWLSSPVEDINGFIEEKNGFVTHGDYVIYFNNCLMGFLQETELEINNIKQFKNEVATFIYKSSEEPDNAMY